MKDDIMIAGYSVAELKKAREAMKKDAVQIISENIDKAKALLATLQEVVSVEVMEVIAGEAVEYLETASVISDVTDVAYYLEFREDGYGGSLAHDLESHLEENDIDYWGDKTKTPNLYKLSGLLENMESESRNWHSSRC